MEHHGGLWGSRGNLRCFTFPLFVHIYLLSLHENFGQEQMQGYAEKKAEWLRVGDSDLLDNVGWLQ